MSGTTNPPVGVVPLPDLAGQTTAAARATGPVSTTPLNFRDYVGANDSYDFYAITVTSNSIVNFNFLADTPAGIAQPSSGYTAGLALYAANGTTQISFAEFPVTGAAAITKALGPGTYYLKVDNPSLQNIGSNYSLTLTSNPTTGNVIPSYITDALLPPAGAFLFVDNSIEAQAGRLYQAAFGRPADDAGVAFWAGTLHAGTSLTDVANAFINSAEFQAKYGNLSNADFLTALYQNVLFRAPDADGLNFWQPQLDNGTSSRAQVLANFSESAENKAHTPASANAQSAARLYWSELGRAPDSAGLQFWTSQLSNNAATLVQEADALATSPEFISRYGNLGNAAFVNLLYQNVLGRAPDTAGQTYWTNALATGTSPGTMVTAFSESGEVKARYDFLDGRFGTVVT